MCGAGESGMMARTFLCCFMGPMLAELLRGKSLGAQDVGRPALCVHWRNIAKSSPSARGNGLLASAMLDAAQIIALDGQHAVSV